MDRREERRLKIAVDGVSHTYRGRTFIDALDNVSFEVFENEFLAIVGPSGCGKTTLLQIMAGLLKPSKGRVLVEGREVPSPSAQIGYVFQEDAVFPWLTVQDNIEFGLLPRNLDMDERKRIAQHYVELVGLKGFESALPRELSVGMSKMVELARTLVLDPPVLLLDEPFGSLDAQTRARMQDELSRIWEQAWKTAVLVTHDVDEAIYLGDRVMVFSPRPGRIRAQIPIRLPRPRRSEARLSTEFMELRRTVWANLGMIEFASTHA